MKKSLLNSFKVKCLLLLLTFFSYNSIKAQVLFDNGPIFNSAGTGAGGANESVLYSTTFAMSTLGFGHQTSFLNRVADDFNISVCQWKIDSIVFFGYQTGSTTTSTFTEVNFRIWNGMPNEPTSTLLFGDTSTNRLTSTSWSGVYRITETTVGNTSRPIMRNVCTIAGGITIPAGAYWLDWSSSGSLGSGPWAAPRTPMSVAITGNGKQRLTGGIWNNAIDGGTGNPAQGFPFIIYGSVVGSTNAGANQAICIGDSATITATSASIYSWDNGSNSATITVSPTVTTDYIVTGTDTISGCISKDTVTITVNALPTVTANTTSAAVCNGNPVTLTGGGATSYLWDNGVTDATSFVPASTTTYTVTGTDANGCKNTASQLITVNAIPNAVATPSTQNACSGNAITNIALTSAVVGTTYNWTRDNTVDVTGIAATGSGDISGTLTNTTGAPITVTFTITPFANGCTGAAITATVLVNPVTTAVATPLSETICSGAAITTKVLSGTLMGTTFNWTRDNIATVTGIAANGTGDISGILNNLTAAPITVTFTVTPSINNCPGTAITASVLVNPLPTVNTIANQTICNGAPTSAVNFTGNVSGTTYNWTNNTTGIGLAASGTGNIPSFVATNTGITPITGTITVTPSAGAAIGGLVSQTFNYTGVPETWTVPAGVTSININARGAKGANGSNHVNSGVGGNGGLGSNVTGTLNVVPGDVIYIRVGGAAVGGIGGFNGGGNGGIGGTPVGGGGGGASDIRTFGNTTSNRVLVAAGGGGGGAAGNFDGFSFSGNPAVNGGNFSSNGSNSNSGAGGFGATSYLGGLAGSGCGGFLGASGTNGDVNGVGGAGGNVSLFFRTYGSQGGGAGAGGGGGLIGGGAGGAGSSGTTACGYNGTGAGGGGARGTSYIGGVTSGVIVDNFQVGDGAITITYNTSSTCTGTPINYTYTVNPTPTAVATPIAETICSGATITTKVLSGTVTGTVYNWTRDNAISVTGIAASGTGDISGVLNNTTAAPITVTFTITPSYTNAGTTCTGTPITATVLVNPAPNAIATPATQTICSGSSITDIVLSSSIVGTTYTWTRDNTITATGIAANGTGNITGNLTNTTNVPITVTFTITPTAVGGCTVTTTTATVVVNPTATLNAIANQTVCNGNPVSAVAFGTTATGGTVVYNWTNNTTSIGLAATGAGNITSFNGVNTTTVPIIATITVTPTFTNNSVSCVGTPRVFTITVNPTVTVNAVANQTVCNGSPVTAVAFGTTASGGTVVYNWTNNTTSIGLAANGTGNIASFNGVNTTTAPITATITVTPTFTSGAVSCVGTPRVFTITINPTATINAITNQTVCNGSPVSAVTFGTTSTVGTVVYNWTNNTTSIGLAATGTGNITSFNGVNTTTAPITATITVTPTFTNNSVSCIGTPRVFTITVNPTATVNAVSNQTVCNGSPVTAVNFGTTASGGTIVYNWTNNASSIGLAATGTGNITSFNGVNTTTAPITATITVTPTFTNNSVSCIGTPRVFTITVNPTATVNTVANQTVCNGSPVSAVVFGTTASGGTVVYNWTNNTTSIGLAATGIGNIASFNGVNTTTAPITATITVTPTFTSGAVSCVGTSRVFTITVNPTATVNAVSNQTVCNGSPVTAVNFGTTASGGTVVYNWTNNTTSIGLAATGTGNINSFNGVNTTTAPVTATVTVTPTFTSGAVSCVGTPRVFTITVNPTATVNPISNQVLCNSFATTAINFSSPASGGTIAYNWTNSASSIGLAATGTGNIASFTATNTTQVPVVATINVAASFTNGGVTCTGPNTQFTITVNPTPIVTLAAFAAICKNAATITLTGGLPLVTVGTTGFYTVDNVTQTVFNPANYMPGLHTIVYTYTNIYGCVRSATQTILVHPVHNVEITLAPNRALSPGTPVTAVATVSPPDNYTYNWSKNNAAIITSPTNTDRILIQANDAGNYKVVVTAPTGCVVTSASVFTESATIPTTLFVFPNPSTGLFNVSYNNGAVNLTARTLNIYDGLGQKVFTKRYDVNVPFGNMQVDLRNKAAGTYLIELLDSNGKQLGITRVIKTN